MSDERHLTNILFVFLSEEKSDHQNNLSKKYHHLRLCDLKQDRQTYLSHILKHSQSLIEKHQFKYLDVIFTGSQPLIKATDIDHIQSHLKQSPFVCRAGYCVTGKMGIYYNAGDLITLSKVARKCSMNVSIPVASSCAIRVFKGSSSKFGVYDKWNSPRYLDLELALYAKERGDYFKLIEGTQSCGDLYPAQIIEDKIHKAAIYNELFIKNCFNINDVRSAVDELAGNNQFVHANETLNSHLSEIKRSNRKLNYITSKIGNYDALSYDIQENRKATRRSYGLLSLFKPKPNEPVTFSLASIPERATSLKLTIKSIYDQCDQIYVYLNGYDEVPGFLSQSKIKVFRSQDHGDLSANGKVWFLKEENVRGYVFLIDDDIIYPKNYVRRMIETLHKYKHKFAVCVHGSIFSDQLRWYYQRSAMFPFRRALIHDAIVNLPGSGTFAFHADTLEVSYDDFAPFTMVDLILGILCKNQSVPIVSVARHREWLRAQKDTSGRDLWSAFKSVITLHTPTALANGPWNFRSTKAYVLPKFEDVFGTLTSQVIEENKLDKQFLHSAYQETIPELWSFAGRMQLATEKNFQEFLFRVSNDDLDSITDARIYDQSMDKMKSYVARFRTINQKLGRLISECELESGKQGKNLKLLSKIQLNLKYTKAQLAVMDKANKRFLDKKQELSKLTKKAGRI